MIGRFLIFALFVFSAYSLPASKAKDSQAAMVYPSKNLQDTGVINWPVVEAVAGKIENLLKALKTRTALTSSTEVENVNKIVNEMENIVNIHSIQTRGVINISGFLDAVTSILGSTTTRSTLTVAQLKNILKLLNEIEGIVNIHSLGIAPEPRGVINIPGFIDAIKSIFSSSEIESIIKDLNKIEGIINIHSFDTDPEPQHSEGVINVPVIVDVIDNIEKAVGSLKTRSTITSADVETIVEAINKIEGIVNIH